MPHQKPDGRHITDMIAEMGLDAGNVIMVGDSHNDIYAAHAAGIRSIAVSYGYDSDIMNLGKLDMVAHSVPEIQMRLNEIWSK